MLDLCLQSAPTRGVVGGLDEGFLRGLIWFLQDDYCVPGCGLSIQDNYPHPKGALPSEVLILTGIQGDSRRKVKDNETSAFS